jgi:sugar phosphate isomerase/epimerase
MESASGISYIDQLGIQVFGVRELLDKDPQGVFKSLADIGIKNIEFFDPTKLRTLAPMVKDVGMNPLACHFGAGYITGKWDTMKKFGAVPPTDYHFENIVEDCASQGVKFLGISMLMPEERESMDDYRKFADLANKHGEISAKSGVQLYYHNHSFEFKPEQDTTPFDEMLKIFDPKLVKVELDIFWTKITGNDPLAWIKKLNGQLLFIHLKDLKKDTPVDYTVFQVDHKAFLEIGSGIIDWKSVFEAAKTAGAQYALLDQDHTAMDKIESVKKSYEYIKQLGM